MSGANYIKGKKEEPLYYENLNRDKGFIWKIKEDWYGQDHLYLREHKDCIFYTDFIKVREFSNLYFDFYPEEAFSRQIKHITNFYLNFSGNLDREFVYLTKEEMDSYVNRTFNIIDEKISLELSG